MAAYISMFVWLLLCRVLENSVSGLTVGSGSHRRVTWGFALFAMSYMVIVIGLRNGVGDTPAYIRMFQELPENIYPGILDEFDKDKGFFLLSTLFKQLISTDFHPWLFCIAAISGVAVAAGLRRYSEDYLFSVLLFILSIQFVWMLNGIRQFIAVSIFFANTRLIVERKTWRFLFLALCLATIHVTALIMIPIYFICTSKPWSGKMILVCILILAVGLSIDRIAEVFSFALEDSTYEGYIDAMATSDGSNFLRFLVAAAPPAFALFCNRYVVAAKDPMVDLAVNMSVFSAICYYIATLSGGVLIGRVPIYFDLYNLILLPWLVHHCFERRSQKLVAAGLIALYGLFYYFKMVQGLGMDYYSDIITFF